MDLEEYLEAVKTCLDEELEPELGIYDNYPILFDHNKWSEWINFLRNSGKFSRDGDSRNFVYYRRNGSNVIVAISGGVSKWHTTGFGIETNEHTERQLSEYGSSLLVQLKGYSTIDRTSCQRKIADVLLLTGEFILGKDLKVCFPNSVGSSHRGDYSRIVYHEPRSE